MDKQEQRNAWFMTMVNMLNSGEYEKQYGFPEVEGHDTDNSDEEE